MSRDLFTITVDAAAAFERHHSDAYDDRPTLAECDRDEAEYEDDEAQS